MICILSLGYYLSFNIQNKFQTISNKSLFIYPENSNLFVSQFGVLLYGIQDINSFIFDVSGEEVSFINEGNKEDKVITDYTRYIDDTAWNTLLDNETNNTYKTLNNYFNHFCVLCLIVCIAFNAKYFFNIFNYLFLVTRLPINYYIL